MKRGGKNRSCRQLIPAIALLINIMACSASLVGLQPEYPPIEKKSLAILTEFLEVNSLTPTLRWEPFPRPKDLDSDNGGALKHIREVTYELRIWKTVSGKSGELVYSRRGLKKPRHTLEEPLEESTHYLWTVRARFEVNGNRRVIQWGMAGFPLQTQTVPNASCFRFKTP